MKPHQILSPVIALMVLAGCGDKATDAPSSKTPVGISDAAKTESKSLMPGAPIPEGGEELVGADVGIHILNRGPEEVFASFEMVDAKATGFPTGIRARTIGQIPELPWYTQISTPIAREFKQGDTVLVSLWARLIETDADSGEGTVTIYFGQPGETDGDDEQVEPSLNAGLEFGTEWKQFFYPIGIVADYSAPGTKLNLDFGHVVQTMEFAGIQVRLYHGKSIEEISTQ